jgi:hypothetical protein
MSYREQIARFIYEHEARFEDGHLAVHHPIKGDGGGDFEVAGITQRHHPFIAETLLAHINAGNYAEAETLALGFMLSYTSAPVVMLQPQKHGVEMFLRDTIFSRGEVGAVKILQMALGVPHDGRIGPVTKRAFVQAEQYPAELILKLRAARERYEREIVGRSEASPFWRGLVNRWTQATDLAMKLQKEQNNAIPENTD